MYYKTTNESTENVILYQIDSSRQDSRILAIYNGYCRLSPSQVYDFYTKIYGYHIPITSIRRSINTLTKKRLLIKTNDSTIGAWNRLEHIWEVRKNIKNT